MPQYKGPAKKKTPSSKPPKPTPKPLPPSPSSASSTTANFPPLPLQQLLLTHFHTSLLPLFKTLSPTQDLKSLVQEVKSYLYNRDFTSAFGREDYRVAYALRWSPGRALGYAGIFRLPELIEILCGTCGGTEDSGERKRVVCLGGGAGAEIVGLAGLIKEMGMEGVDIGHVEGHRRLGLDVVVVDVADWSGVIEKLGTGLDLLDTSMKARTTSSEFSSTNMRTPDENPSPKGQKHTIGDPSLSISFLQQDVLDMTPNTPTSIFNSTNLITLMFTLNELFSTSISRTTKLLLDITEEVEPGTILLVVDSPGSYSEVSLGSGELSTKDQEGEGETETPAGAEQKQRRYPMKWLLNHSLLEATKPTTIFSTIEKTEEAGTAAWEVILSDDSRWFRVDKSLSYPVELENMRYQIHLFRRI